MKKLLCIALLLAAPLSWAGDKLVTIDVGEDGLRLRHEGLPFGAACLRFGFFCLGLGLFALCDLRLIVDAVEVVARVSLRLVVRRGTACRQQCQQQ